ncbi:hypothetical protein GQ42DRAFT_165185 [Ramicandelaber brevisporus]|nr:hypothetical protein GQ42DRAFT_165185 [Ramicandelaber brevisporus]
MSVIRPGTSTTTTAAASAAQQQHQQQPAEQSVSTATAASSGDTIATEDDDEEIKEYHFHVYFFQNNKDNREAAFQLRERIFKLIDAGYFQVVPRRNGFNTGPIGPHPIGSYEVWCPVEYFAKTYQWFVRNRGELSVLIHPLTKLEVSDHSDRAAWLGPAFPIDLSTLTPVLDHTPFQYPELGLGYSAKKH